MLVYVAGPMTGLPEHNYPAFAAAHVALLEAGLKPVSPSYLPPPCPNPEWSDWMKACIPLMLACEGVALLPDWDTSKGANIERKLALQLGLKVHELDQWVAGGVS